MGSGWYHYDVCPHSAYFNSFMIGDNSAQAYSEQTGRNYYTYDPALYPEIEDEDLVY